MHFQCMISGQCCQTQVHNFNLSFRQILRAKLSNETTAELILQLRTKMRHETVQTNAILYYQVNCIPNSFKIQEELFYSILVLVNEFYKLATISYSNSIGTILIKIFHPTSTCTLRNFWPTVYRSASKYCAYNN